MPYGLELGRVDEVGHVILLAEGLNRFVGLQKRSVVTSQFSDPLSNPRVSAHIVADGGKRQNLVEDEDIGETQISGALSEIYGLLVKVDAVEVLKRLVDLLLELEWVVEDQHPGGEVCLLAAGLDAVIVPGNVGKQGVVPVAQHVDFSPKISRIYGT